METSHSIWTLSHSHPVVLFDGVCKFCNASVNFILDHNTQKHIRFATLQSSVGKIVLEKSGLPENYLDSLVLVSNGEVFVGAIAALKIASRLDVPWSFLKVFLFLPKWLINSVYTIIGRNRYKWFGREDTCSVPTPEIKDRFL